MVTIEHARLRMRSGTGAVLFPEGGVALHAECPDPEEDDPEDDPA